MLLRVVALSFAIGLPGFVSAAVKLDPPDITIGQNLQVSARVRLQDPAQQDLEITVESEDPSKIVFANSDIAAGSRSIRVKASKGAIATTEFYIQGLTSVGKGAYSIGVPGETPVMGAVQLTPSAIVVTGPAKFSGILSITTGTPSARVTLYSAQIDSVAATPRIQALRGGWSVDVEVTSSNPGVGTVAPSKLTLRGGELEASTEFRPAGPGTTTLSLQPSSRFEEQTQFSRLAATVSLPGLGLTDGLTIGKDLEVGGIVSLGEAAPAGGVKIALTSSDPSRLILSTSATDAGTGSIILTVPPGGINATYFLQSLSSSGEVTYAATAPGYRGRTATVNLSPSGLVVVGPEGPPDEAEVLRPGAPVGPHKVLASVSKPTPEHVRIYPVYLDRKTLRGADITVQPLRGGISVVAVLTNSDTTIGSVSSTVTIKGGLDLGVSEFIPRSVGSTTLSVSVPEGFTKPSNATELTVVVTP